MNSYFVSHYCSLVFKSNSLLTWSISGNNIFHKKRNLKYSTFLGRSHIPAVVVSCVPCEYREGRHGNTKLAVS
jgi:hypothetical protein